jgi:hypothetical protein
MKLFTMIACGMVLVAGCGGGGDRPSGDGQAERTEATGPMGTASVSGVVRFAGMPPANPPIDMRDEAACRDKHPDAPVDPQVVVTDGMLANVFVYVKGGLPAGATYTAPTTPVTVDQVGCLYVPRIVGAMVNQPIDILNSDPVLHNIKAVPTANRPFNISQPREGMRTTRTFSTPEVMVPLECNVHGWMHAFVGVMSHPFFAVSAGDGRFSIGRLPAGTYELEAWHEKLGTRTVTVTVADGEAGTAEFTFGPPTT